MAKKRTIEQLLEDRYDDEEVRNAILLEIQQSPNMDAILAGELTLPGEQDAIHWYNRKIGRINETDNEKQNRKRIDAIEAAFKRLTESLDPNSPQKDFVDNARKELEEAGQR